MKQFLRFMLVGLFNTAFGYALIFTFMYALSLSPELSNFLAYTIAIFVSFFLNRSFTFASAAAGNYALVRFIVVFLAAYAANYYVLIVLIHSMGTNAAIGQVLAGIVYVLISFVLNKYFVFRQLPRQLSRQLPRQLPRQEKQ